MHNGEVGGFATIKRALQESLSDEAYSSIRGSTDSEHLFAYAMDSISSEDEQSPDRLANALEDAIRLVEQTRIAASVDIPSLLNLVLTDGSCAAVTRFVSEDSDLEPASLYTHTGRQYVCEDGSCRMVSPDHENGTTLIASEPLSDDPGWDPVPRNHVVTVYPDRTISTRPIRLPRE
jgi:predicted glutamine amidotransferase